MLGFIHALSRDFEDMFGKRANLLYINCMHFDLLRRHFSNPNDMSTMMTVLGMTIMISEDAVNPHLARIAHTTRPRHHPGVPGRPANTP
ncbi:MAG: hypothetical protein LBV36_04790 [Chromatiales bacterium]|jgi:hypothetical protein|nr:hypothetical protein [Chromatiales bacterium]